MVKPIVFLVGRSFLRKLCIYMKYVLIEFNKKNFNILLTYKKNIKNYLLSRVFQSILNTMN